MIESDWDYAKPWGAGFIGLIDVAPDECWHYVNKSQITLIRPVFSEGTDTWTHCEVYTSDGRMFETAACPDDILAAMAVQS